MCINTVQILYYLVAKYYIFSDCYGWSLPFCINIEPDLSSLGLHPRNSNASSRVPYAAESK